MLWDRSMELRSKDESHSIGSSGKEQLLRFALIPTKKLYLRAKKTHCSCLDIVAKYKIYLLQAAEIAV